MLCVAEVIIFLHSSPNVCAYFHTTRLVYINLATTSREFQKSYLFTFLNETLTKREHHATSSTSMHRPIYNPVTMVTTKTLLHAHKY